MRNPFRPPLCIRETPFFIHGPLSRDSLEIDCRQFLLIFFELERWIFPADLQYWCLCCKGLNHSRRHNQSVDTSSSFRTTAVRARPTSTQYIRYIRDRGDVYGALLQQHGTGNNVLRACISAHRMGQPSSQNAFHHLHLPGRWHSSSDESSTRGLDGGG